MPVQGIRKVKNNMRRLRGEIEGRRTESAVYAVLSQGGAAAATMTPVDTGTLINSHFVEIRPGAGKVVGVNGYSAEYAAAVHSAPGVLAGKDRPKGRGQYWDPGGEPEFLKRGFAEIQASVKDILRRAYRDFDRRA